MKDRVWSCLCSSGCRSVRDTRRAPDWAIESMFCNMVSIQPSKTSRSDTLAPRSHYSVSISPHLASTRLSSGDFDHHSRLSKRCIVQHAFGTPSGPGVRSPALLSVQISHKFHATRESTVDRKYYLSGGELTVVPDGTKINSDLKHLQNALHTRILLRFDPHSSTIQPG